MIQQQYFEEQGWTGCPQNKHPLHPSADFLWQKREQAGNSTLFFWNIWHYPKDRIQGHPLDEAYQMDVQLTLPDEGPVFNMSVGNIESPQEVEEAMSRIRHIYAAFEWESYD